LKTLSRKWFFVAGLITLSFVSRLGRLNDSIFEISEFRQTQTAFGIKSIAENNLNILSAEVPVLGPPWKIPFEFPFYQWVSAFLSNLFNLDFGVAGRLVSTGFFLVTALGLYKLVSFLVGEFAAIVSLPIFLFSSFGIQWGSAVLIEWSATAFLIWGIYFLFKHVEKNKAISFWLASSVIFLSLASLIKVTSTVPWLFGMVLYLVLKDFSLEKIKLQSIWILGLAVSYFPTFLWNSYADRVKSQNPFTEWLTSENLTTWNFGTLGQRLDPETWFNILRTVDQTILGSTVLFFSFVSLYIFINGSHKKEFLLFSGIVALAPIFFVNLYLAHMYYLSAIYPAIVAVIAVVLTESMSKAQNLQYKLMLILPMLMILFLGYVSDLGRFYIKNFRTDNGIPAASTLIKENTSEDSKIIIMGCDWDPHTLYFAERKGLMLIPGRYPESALTQDVLNQFDYFYDCNEEIKAFAPVNLNLFEVKDNLYQIKK
jgi:4-amino-4-deoxy-L-arabinose transferase-like glycosyltransferase